MAKKKEEPKTWESIVADSLTAQYTRPIFCRICGQLILWYGPSNAGPATSQVQKDFERRFEVHYDCAQREGNKDSMN